jgi:hypothetical protein
LSYATLAAYSNQLNIEYSTDELTDEDIAWLGSPFAWIREHASGTKGSIGRGLAAAIFESIAPPVVRTGLALRVNGAQIRVKFSMAWNLQSFRFQQVRDDPFEYIFCLGLRPDVAYGWLIPRPELIVDGVWQERDNLTGQHGGIVGTDTHWFEVDPANPPEWLVHYGGTLAQVEARISETFL